MAVDEGYLMVREVPYVTTDGTVAYAALADELTADQGATPRAHTMWFTGSDPCDDGGRVLATLSRPQARPLTAGLKATHQFSRKPTSGPTNYGDYHTKFTAYIAMLEPWARRVDPTATSRTFPALADDDGESPFRYLDTASSRAGIVAAAEKLKLAEVAIVGLGGTGSYLLDQLAKLPIQRIHLYDGDVFSQHNAFRAPGAASLDELAARPKKVEYLRDLYDPMHRGIVPHPVRVDVDNLHEFDQMDFVFMAFDSGPEKNELIKRLVDRRIPFIDVGMGLSESDASLVGQLRMSSIDDTNAQRALDPNYIPQGRPDDDDYDLNVQVADMNALNAILAIVRFKKMIGFYADYEGSPRYLYGIFDNSLIAESPT